ncbi:CoA ester lyase [Microbacterium sp. EST19A]|uniref:HpcH/HpaI aldolase/citrate lyase family protein n=1 Tax=Microbacterium sp. EST19A TaxID=2862681 RepID=UPI001CBF4272|nr:CoA ester lyase [Microbacterium sp. EST19A]
MSVTKHPSVARTWLLVNAAHPSQFASSLVSGADQVIFDLEDAIDPRSKETAREAVADFLSTEDNRAWVRVNDRNSDHWANDLDALKHLPGLMGVMLAKTEAGDQVTATYSRLAETAPVVALIESAVGIEYAVSIAKARGSFRLAFGSGDYRGDTGATAEDLAMAYPRSRLVIASRVANLPGPIDGPAVASSHSLVRAQSEVAVSLGMTGKLCLSPDQLAVVNEVLSPSPSDISWARAFLTDFDDRGRVVRDGSDPPRLRRATKILERARAFDAS